MSNTNFEVSQDTYKSSADDQGVRARLNRRRELVIPDFYMQLVVDGRVFIASNAAMQTADDIGRKGGYLETEPSIAVDVPSGTTMMPLEIMMRQGGTVANAIFDVYGTVDDKVRISTGTACTPRNYLIYATEPRTAACTIKIHDESSTNLATSAPAEDNTFFHAQLVHDLDALKGGHIFWSAKENIAPIIEGPGSMCIYAYVATAEPQFFWHVIWAEIPTVSMV